MSPTEPVSAITDVALRLWQGAVQRQLAEIEAAARKSEGRGPEWQFDPEHRCWTNGKQP